MGPHLSRASHHRYYPENTNETKTTGTTTTSTTSGTTTSTTSGLPAITQYRRHDDRAHCTGRLIAGLGELNDVYVSKDQQRFVLDNLNADVAQMQHQHQALRAFTNQVHVVVLVCCTTFILFPLCLQCIHTLDFTFYTCVYFTRVHVHFWILICIPPPTHRSRLPCTRRGTRT